VVSPRPLFALFRIPQPALVLSKIFYNKIPYCKATSAQVSITCASSSLFSEIASTLTTVLLPYLFRMLSTFLVPFNMLRMGPTHWIPQYFFLFPSFLHSGRRPHVPCLFLYSILFLLSLSLVELVTSSSLT